MIKIDSVRSKLIVYSVLSCLIPYIAGSVYISKLIIEKTRQNYINGVNEVMERVHRKIDERLMQPLSEDALDKLQKLVSGYRVGGSGYLMVLDENNKFIISPKDRDWLLKTPDEINVPGLANMLAKGDGLFEENFNGKRQYMNMRTFSKSGWKVVTVIDGAELTQQVNQILFPCLIILGIIFFLILLSLLQIVKQITKPIRELTAGALAIAYGNLDVRVDMQRNDEFGILATKLNEISQKLKDSFNEIADKTAELHRRETENETLVEKSRNMEKHLVRLERLNIVGEMAAGIAHEVRNPLTTVRGYLQFLGRKEKYLHDELTFDLMIEELDRANGIISEFLSLAKNKPASFQTKNLNTIIQTLLPLMQADAFVCNSEINIALLPVRDLLVDEKDIRQLILNMVRNGIEAMLPDGGILTIKTYVEEEQVVLAISDQGSGIKAEYIDKLGMPFITTKENGTGLGLAVCYRIAASHKAKINVRTSSQGTCFFVRFGY